MWVSSLAALAVSLGLYGVAAEGVISTGQKPLNTHPRLYLVAAEEPTELIRAAQSKLNELGYKAGPADGIAGRKTRKAVRSFQKENGLPVTGKIDTQLIFALQQAKPRGQAQSSEPAKAASEPAASAIDTDTAPAQTAAATPPPEDFTTISRGRIHKAFAEDDTQLQFKSGRHDRNRPREIAINDNRDTRIELIGEGDALLKATLSFDMPSNAKPIDWLNNPYLAKFLAATMADWQQANGWLTNALERVHLMRAVQTRYAGRSIAVYSLGNVLQFTVNALPDLPTSG